jgi:predicted Ser/Thr protein kinase
MATWPDLTEYHEAVQSPQRSLGDAELQKAQIDKDRFGMPKPATGGNAVVYKATVGQNVWAVRCFLRPISDHAERYAAISKHLQKNRSAHATEFVYLADGLRIKGGTFPIVKMAWVQGQHLDRFVEGILDQPRELAALRERFRTLVKDIERAKFAHGDLQHGNILVTGKDLLLIDYDGIWVPALIGRQATEIGHRAYQHPKRSMTDYGPHLDRFSALVIYLALRALEIDRKLWDTYYTGDNLLFVREDFNEPGRSPVWSDLAALKNAEVTYLAGILAAMVSRPVKDLPRLEAVLSNSAGIRPMELKPVARAPEKPRWNDKPSKSGTAADLAPQWKVVWTRPGEKTESRWKKVMKDGPVVVESEVEVLAPNPGPLAAIALGAMAAGVLIGTSVAPELGMVAAGGGLLVTRGIRTRRKKRAFHTVMRPTEQQELEHLKVAVPGHKSAVTALQCSADGRRLAVVTKFGECATWELDTDSYKVSGVRLPPFEQSVLASGTPKTAVVTDKSVLVADLGSGLRVELAVDSSNRAAAVAATADGARVAIGQHLGQVHIVEVMTKKTLVQIAGVSSRVGALAFSEDGAFLALGWTTGMVQIHRLTPKPEKVGEGSQHRTAVTALAAAPKGQSFASADDSGQVVIWGRNGQKQATANAGGRGVKSLVFLGEHAIAAGCGDGTVKILNPSSGAVMATHNLGTAAITALAFAKDKMALAVGTQSGQVVLLALEA